MEGFEPLALVVGASGGLAVDGDAVVPSRLHGGDEGPEAAREQRRIDPVHQIAQPAGARHAVMEVTEAAQEIEVALTPKNDLVEVVAGGDGGAGHQKQDLLERVGDAPALALVVQLSKVLEQDRQSVRGERHLHRLVHRGDSSNQSLRRNHIPSVKTKPKLTRTHRRALFPKSFEYDRGNWHHRLTSMRCNLPEKILGRIPMKLIGLMSAVALSITASICSVTAFAQSDCKTLVKASPFGPDDETGATNRVTPAVTKAAAAEIQIGTVTPMAYNLVDGVPLFGTRFTKTILTSFAMVPGAEYGKNKLSYMEDTYLSQSHVGTHIDGMGHIGIRD